MQKKEMYKLFTVALFALSTILGLSQNCGTRISQQSIQYLKNRTQKIDDSRNKVVVNSNSTYVPIQFHLITHSFQQGDVDLATISRAKFDLNSHFEGAGIEFYECSSVNYIQNDQYYNFFNDSLENYLAIPNDVPNVINIYITGPLYVGGSSVAGFTNYPPGEDRVFISREYFSNGSTLSHEIGHYFSLYHTHGPNNDVLTDELVNGTNCNYSGDEICDTPADPNLSGIIGSFCTYNGTSTDINGDTYAPDVANIMSYSFKTCRTHFSEEQLLRVQYCLMNDRNNLHCDSPIENQYCDSYAMEYYRSQIVQVKFNSLDFESNDTCTGYSYSEDRTTAIIRGENYNLTIESDDCLQGTDVSRNIKVYIDWNHDLDFSDAGEVIVSESLSAPGSVSEMITIPINATIGKTKMRVVCAEGELDIFPCGIYHQGEVEDFDITILSPIDGPCSDITCENLISQFPYEENFENETKVNQYFCGPAYEVSAEGWSNLKNSVENVGMNTHYAGGSSYYSDYSQGLYFNVNNACTLKGVHVYANDPGQVMVRIFDSTGSVIIGHSVYVSSKAKTFVPLNIELEVGNNYRIDAGSWMSTTTNGLRRNFSGASYPYESNSGELTITGAVNGLNSYYYFFYDWEVESSCKDNIDWITGQGETSSNNTGPHFDFSEGNAEGRYLYIESSCNTIGYPTKEAVLLSPCYNLSSCQEPELSFAYHMFGSGMGSLFVDVNIGDGWMPIWQEDGQISDLWQIAEVDLTSFIDFSTVKLRFRGWTGNSYTSDMAIDQIKIYDNANSSSTSKSVLNSTEFKSNEIRIYPNPASESSIVKVNSEKYMETVSLCVFNAQGEAMTKEVFTNVGHELQTNLDFKQLTSGIYFVVFSIDGQESVKKISIQKIN